MTVFWQRSAAGFVLQRARATLLLASSAIGLFCGAGHALAQSAPQPPSSPGPMPVRPDDRGFHRGFGMRMDETTRILPPGPWWKDQDLVQRLDLTADQQKRIDDTFLQAKVGLIHMHASLDEEQLLLEPMLNVNPVDQGKVLAQIGKIADMRADLEKATAKMLLQIRSVLTQAQWTRLQQERPSGMRQHMFPRGSDGPPHSSLRSPALTPDAGE